MPKAKTLHSAIIYYFILTSSITFFILGSYMVYDYRKELKENLHSSLIIMAEDIIEHRLYDMPAEELKSSFHFLEDYHNATFVALFDTLTFTYTTSAKKSDDRIEVIKRLPDTRYLCIASGLSVVNAKTESFIIKILSVFGTVFLLFAVVFHLLLKRLFQPLHCLVQFCNDSSMAHNSLPLCNGTQEVDALKRAIIDLMESNRTLCENKQDVFKEAAHELKSPVAILKARLSLFRQRDDYNKSLFVKEGLEDISTITHRLKELLFLKSIEWDLKQEKEAISVQEQCAQMQKAFRPILEKKGITMLLDRTQDFTLHVQKEAMTKVMQAIFENIFMHTRNDSVIKEHIDPKKRQMQIINEIGSKSDETLFSSYIGSKIIARLASRLGYTYNISQDDTHFYTTITFHVHDGEEALPKV